MLGGYMVYSQKSQQQGQIMPGSKAKQLSPVLGRPEQGDDVLVPAGTKTNAPHLMMSSSKGGVFVTSSQQGQGTSTSAVSATNRPPVFMYGSKSAAVVRPEALQAKPIASNPPTQMMMPSSKVLIMQTRPFPSVTTNNASTYR